MSTPISQTFLALTRNSADLDWLQDALAPLGQVLKAGRGSLDELVALVDVTGAGLLFVGLDRDNVLPQTALIEGVLEARPLLVVVALGDGMDNQLVLNAMRAGARDFLAYGARPSEVAGLTRRLTRRLPSAPPSRNHGRVTALYCRQQDGDAALLATHLALAIQQAGQRTLLLDLGAPEGDSVLLLGLDAAFHFSDALRNLRRLDANLIDSAFCAHPQGLRVLGQGTTAEPLERISAAELYLLLGALRQHFQHIVINLAGQPDGEALRLLIGSVDRLLWCCDQNVLDCRRNIDQLTRWRELGLKLGHASLLVDRYVNGAAPDSDTLGRSFELPVFEVLPFEPRLRLDAKNLGRPLFELAPRERLSQRLRALGQRLAEAEVAVRGWRRLWRDRA